MAEKIQRAGGVTVGAGLEYHHQVTHVRDAVFPLCRLLMLDFPLTSAASCKFGNFPVILPNAGPAAQTVVFFILEF